MQVQHDGQKILTLCLLLPCFWRVRTVHTCSDPNYKNGPYPCSPDEATWFSISACVLYAVSASFSCCLPRPLPVMMRVKESMPEDETDSCFAVFAKKPPPEENEEEGDVEEAGATEKMDVEEADATEEKDVEEADATEEKEPSGEEVRITVRMTCAFVLLIPVPSSLQYLYNMHAFVYFLSFYHAQPLQQEQLLRNQQAEATIAVALATVRRSKQEEIEKQLELLTTYKDRISEEEYGKKVAKLLHALPDPDTYDAYTKMGALLVAPAEGKEVETEEGSYISETAEDGEGEGDDEEEEEEEQKKSSGNVISSTISSGVTSVKKSQTTPAQADAGNSAIE